MLKISFHGAARGVTGSKFLIEYYDKKILLECGLFQGPRAKSEDINRNFPFDPGQIDAVLLSHAHIDHSGNLPNLVKAGYHGPIHMTTATADLASLMLLDAAHIQEQDYRIVNEQERRTGAAEKKPLYTREDAQKTIQLFHGYAYHESFQVVPGVHARFYDAGHILGSAMIELDFQVGKNLKRLVFSGDLGRWGFPVLRDPETIRETDILMMESTYGNRSHSDWEDTEKSLGEIIRRTAEGGGRVVIPAFSIGRTQLLTFLLRRLYDQKKFPKLPIFVDSPLAVNATEIFMRHPDYLDPGAARKLSDASDPHGFQLVTYVRDVEESKAINTFRQPCIIISASGMCEAGRILHHLRHSITDPRNAVLIVGYQAEGTLGRKIVEGAPIVKIFGKEYPLRCAVYTLSALSAHAGRSELEAFVQRIEKKPERVIVVHGEPRESEPFVAWLKNSMRLDAHLPSPGESLGL